MTKEEIEVMIRMNLPFAIRNKKGAFKFPFISQKAADLVVEGLVEGLYEKLNKKDK